MTDDELAEVERLRADIEKLREENRQLRGTSTPEIESNINRLAFELGVTLGHLHHTGGRELECLLQRLEAVEVRAARLRAALEDIARGDYSDPMCQRTPEARARAALEGGR